MQHITNKQYWQRFSILNIEKKQFLSNDKMINSKKITND
jgi:hypothetical protein